MKYKITYSALAILLIFNTLNTSAQNKSKTKLSADVVSNYLWRGSPGYSPLSGQNVLSPSFQPTLAWTKGNFEVGAWGSSDFTGTYKEVDFYASYTMKDLTLTVTDYYWNLDWLNDKFFDYNNDSTSHILEAALTYKFPKFPLSVQVATMFYGADKKPADIKENNYSTYVELIYSLPVGDDKLDISLGMTPGDGYYGDGYGGEEGFAVVNAAITGYRKIKITNDFELPLKAALICNPQHQKAYLVFGFTL
ncbi:MAG: hypothetical protein AB9842_09300 [Bacteroidales bacterium]